MGRCSHSVQVLNPEVLYLTLTHRWYDMIDSGVKLEEYRELSDYWVGRLRDKSRTCIDKVVDGGRCSYACWGMGSCGFAPFKEVCFMRGYSGVRMRFECLDVTIGRGRPEWGAPEDRDVFIIKLGKRI